MTEFQYDIPVPDKQRELLLKLASISKQKEILSVGYTVHKHNQPPYTLTFDIGNEKVEVQLQEDPLPGFEVLGLIKKIDEHPLFLAPKLFKWAEYEQKNEFMKWVARNPNIARDILLALSILLSLFLLVLRFLQN